jgi:hypothetical protein
MRHRLFGGWVIAIVVAVVLVLGHGLATRLFRRTFQPVRTKKTVAERLEEYGPAARQRLTPAFARLNLAYPPKSVTLVGLKHERQLEVWVGDGGGGQRRLKAYPILAASGRLGPKLREGDRQVPEGLYHIELLNPNSRYHLSLRVSYPNAFDRAKGHEDARDTLGGDIMIHGGAKSIGCIAVGDPAAEELFVLAADVGLENVRVILSPVDFRVRELPADMPPVPPWTPDLFAAIRRELAALVDGH